MGNKQKEQNMDKCRGATFIDFLKCLVEVGNIVVNPFIEIVSSLGSQDSYVSGDQTTESYKCYRLGIPHMVGMMRFEIPCDTMDHYPRYMAIKVPK